MDLFVKSAMSSQVSSDTAQARESINKNTHCEPAKRTADKTDNTGKAHGSCKSSAPCCLGIAMMSSSQRMFFSAEHDDALAVLIALHTSFPARALERPPKKQLA
ncbi:hypothetical protein [Undibacterium sp. TJN19]|uniref:hypothetical protein n=1 Tax=Undibacterium sp. TJN19 TaxID=3413055 RepID=UPI003BF2A660